MELKEYVKRAAKQQSAENNRETVNIQKTVNLEPGRKSTYTYNGEGRPVTEGCEAIFDDGQILNE